MRSNFLETTLTTSSLPPSSIRSRRWKEDLLSAAYCSGRLDRVNVLGSDTTGHTGCVNALSWARGGDILISSGDDTTVRLWRLDVENDRDYSFNCDAVIHTGHRANIFNAQMLPHSSRIVTVAGDRQIRVFDHEKAGGLPGSDGETQYYARQAAIRVLRCHQGRVKRIVTEDSPDLFLTVAEDGSVRQHDLRVPHTCSVSCPAPLVQLSHELSTLSLSPLTPYQFVVAGASPFGYLFDRRHAGRHFREEWGQPPDSGEVTTCVRRFGRAARGQHERRGLEHITGSRMASSNGHEVLLSYSSDSVYLYSTKDDPQPSSMATEESSILPSYKRKSGRRPPTERHDDNDAEMDRARSERDALMDEDIERIRAESTPSPQGLLRPTVEEDSNTEGHDSREDDHEELEEEEEDEEEEEEDSEPRGDERYAKVPTIMPRSRFSGACNVETVKDVNFLGPRDEFVVSGSDDGNWFMWEKDTGRLHDILEGDGTVVNVIEGHPYLPLVAVSGIDTTVKLFAPTPGPSSFSRLDRAESIISRNAEAATARSELSNLLLYYRLARQLAENGGEGVAQCPLQ
ncbi:WD40 repeat-like protein [Pilatotrama ljubarskyi]|nr:WD40 repeat-like protein [Pilatotrama ljubarskyi]